METERLEEIMAAVGRHVSLQDIALQIGVHGAGSANRMAVARGFKAYQLREAKNAKYYLSKEDAEKFIKKISDEKKNIISLAPKQTASKGLGGVYCIEVPSYDGKNKIKIGWTDSFEQRLSSYKTIIPDLKIKALWPCKDNWMERAAHKVAEQVSNKVFTELFEFNDINEGVVALNNFFETLGIKNISV